MADKIQFDGSGNIRYKDGKMVFGASGDPCCCGGGGEEKFCWVRYRWNCNAETVGIDSGTNAGCSTLADAGDGGFGGGVFSDWDTWQWVDDSHLLYLQKGP